MRFAQMGLATFDCGRVSFGVVVGSAIGSPFDISIDISGGGREWGWLT